jgi:glycosyltransferase involved in cell wall biosynthesis
MCFSKYEAGLNSSKKQIKIAYLKNGNVVEELKEVYADEELPTGGPLNYIASVLRAISAANGKVLLISFFNQNACLEKQNIKGRVFNTIRPRSHIAVRLYSKIAAALKIFIILFKFRPDLILCTRTRQALWPSYLISRLLSIPIVFSLHVDLQKNERGIERYFRKVDFHIIRKLPMVICHGPFLKQQLVNIGVQDRQIAEFNAGCQDLYKYSRKKAASTVSRMIKKLSDFTVILYVGRIESDKGIFDLLEAVKERLDIDKTIKLVYAGTGNDCDDLKEKIRQMGVTDQVLLLGKISRATLPFLFRKSKVIVTPTRSSFPEGRCMATMEGLAFGLPAIAPNSGPFPFLIKHGVNGLLFRQDSVPALQKSLLSILDNPERYKQLKLGTIDSKQELLNPSVTYTDVLSRAIELIRAKK